jgi:3-hydroxyacyl-CoA dehydrogenase
MGTGIAVALLGAGLRVTLVDRDRPTLAKGLERIAGIQERAVAAGRQSAEARDADWARLGMGVDAGALAGVDLAIEAVTEDRDIKRAVLRDMAAAMRPGAVLASNTSYLDLDDLAAHTGRPGDVIGLHFFAPAHVMKLLEVVVGRASAPDAVATGLALARRLGKTAVRASVCDGFIANRMLTAYRTAADFLLEDGASPAQIDGAMRHFGFPLGPYQVLDLAGLDISWARRKRLAATRDPAARYVTIGDRLCEAGHLGQKTGRGYYRYDGSRHATEDPDALAIIAQAREDAGVVARKIGRDEILLRCLTAMANEGARILGEGIALRAGDIDVAMIAGFGFPRWEGGPMFWAEARGAMVLKRDIGRFAEQAPQFWQVAPLIDDLIRTGRHFRDVTG